MPVRAVEGGGGSGSGFHHSGAELRSQAAAGAFRPPGRAGSPLA